MPYLDSTMDEFLELACESVFSDRKKKTVDDLLKKAEKVLNKKLKTVADCDDYLAAIKNESNKFNECLRALQVAKKKYDAGKLVPKDFDETVKASVTLLNKNCKQLKANLGDFVDDKRAVTAEEIEAFNSYVKGLSDITKKIRNQRKASAAKEDASYFDFDFDFNNLEMDMDDLAYESADEDGGKDENEDEDDEDDDKKSKSKKSSKKSKKDEDDDEDDTDDSDEDEDDDKGSKSKKSSKKDDDLGFDTSDFDFGDDDESDDDDKDDKKSKSKSKKDDDDEGDTDDSDEDEDDEDDDKKSKSKKSSKKSKKDDGDDEDEDEEDDDKDDKKSAKESVLESVFGDIFDYDD